jgi:hypothetical protein
MKYRFVTDHNCIRIFARDGEVGTIELPCEQYPVRTAEGELIGSVRAIEDALPLLFDHWDEEERSQLRARQQARRPSATPRKAT